MSSFLSFAVKPNADRLLKKGKALYALEKASWISTDHFLRHFSDKADKASGYFSYDNGDELITLFYSDFDTLQIYARYHLEKDSPHKIIGVPESRNIIPVEIEDDLIEMRGKAVKKIKENKDGYITYYKGISFNLLPVINENESCVYVLSASHVDDFIYMGNDYKLKFDKNNKYRGIERIHKSLIKLNTKSSIDSTQNATLHTHLGSDVISPTDICTLLLYRDMVDWNMHYVMGKKYVSVFDLSTEKLMFIKIRDWKKMSKP